MQAGIRWNSGEQVLKQGSWESFAAKLYLKAVPSAQTELPRSEMLLPQLLAAARHISL